MPPSIAFDGKIQGGPSDLLGTMAGARDPEIDDRGPIQSIDRAAAVLSLFDEGTRTLTPTLVARRLGMNRTTAHRYLQALQAAGFLSPVHGPGPLIEQLSAFVSPRQRLMTLAPRVLRRLSDHVGLTAIFTVRGIAGAVVAHVEEARDTAILLTVRAGAVLDPHAAESRVLLAYETDPDFVARAHSGLGPAETQREHVQLAKVRREGLAWAHTDVTGLESAAVPVFGDAHDVVAALSLLGTTALFAGADGKARVTVLRQAAEDLGASAAQEAPGG